MLLLVGCGGDGYTPELRAIDTIINEKPDSALRLLDSLSTEAGNSVAKTCNQVSSNYKRGCVNTIGTPPLTIYMICVNATAVVAHNRQNRMVMSVFTLQKYCKNGNLQGGGKPTLRREIPKNGVSKMAKLRPSATVSTISWRSASVASSTNARVANSADSYYLVYSLQKDFFYLCG